MGISVMVTSPGWPEIRETVELLLPEPLESKWDRIIALDPGGTTGVCEWNKGVDLIQAYQVGPDEHHFWLNGHLDMFVMGAHLDDPEDWDLKMFERLCNRVLVICETFEHRQNLQKAKVELVSREYIGIVRLAAQ
jgi:hypothetical protein